MSIERRPAECPTCNGWVWSERLGKFIRRRETVGMVCSMCGHDYGADAA